MASFTLLVAVLMLYVLPNRQAAVLEASMRDETDQCSLGFGETNLSALEELNEQVSFDGRNPIVAIINTSGDDPP